MTTTTECRHCHADPCTCSDMQRAYKPPSGDTPEQIAHACDLPEWVIERRIQALIDASREQNNRAAPARPAHPRPAWSRTSEASGAEISACCPGSTSDDDAIEAAKRVHVAEIAGSVPGAVPTPMTKGLTGVWLEGVKPPEDPKPKRLSVKLDQTIRIATDINVRGAKRRRCGLGCWAKRGAICDLFDTCGETGRLRKSKRHPDEYMRCRACLDAEREANQDGTTEQLGGPYARSLEAEQREAESRFTEDERRTSCGVFTKGQPGGDCDGDGHHMCKRCALWSGTKSE